MLLYAIDVILKLDFGGFRTWLDEWLVPPGDSLNGTDMFGAAKKDMMTGRTLNRTQRTQRFPAWELQFHISSLRLL